MYPCTILKYLCIFSLLAINLASTQAFADCFAQGRSKAGAELYIPSPNARVRIEHTTSGYDLGMKLSETLGEDFTRVAVAPDQALELIGQIVTVNDLGKVVTREVSRVFLAADQLIIISNGQVMIRDLHNGKSSSATCREARSNESRLIHEALKSLGLKAQTRIVRVTSDNAFTQAIGL